jgi:photosystem II stability/assembly factor-like uncharacterized protein
MRVFSSVRPWARLKIPAKAGESFRICSHGERVAWQSVEYFYRIKIGEFMKPRTSRYNSQYWKSLAAAGLLLAMLLSACAAGASSAPTQSQPAQLPGATTAAPTSAPTPTELVAPPTATISSTVTMAVNPTTTLTSTARLPAFTWIDMLDTQNGYGLDEQNLYRTQDGGSQWNVVTPPGVTANFSTFFLNAQSGWMLVGNPQDLSESTLYHTADGGQNWTSTPAPFGMGRLQFLDEQNGWAMANISCGAGSCDLDIFKTTDAGQTWDKVSSATSDNNNQPSTLPFVGDKNGMTFLDMQHGWVGGSEPKDGYVWLFATKDGGQTWKQVNLPLPNGYTTSTISVDPPEFFGSQDGVMPVTLFINSSHWVLYITHDGGQSWTPGSVVDSGGLISTPTAQDFFIWDGGTLHASHDGGQTWIAITPNINLSQIIAQLDFVDKDNGWATSMDSNMKVTLYKTNDGGQTWVAVGQ